MIHTAVLYSIALSSVILIAGFVPLFLKWRSHHFDVFLSFGAGVLLSAAFIHMFPLAVQGLGERAGVFVLVGFLIILVVEKFTMAHACGEEACPNHQVGVSALFGLSVHSILTGIAVGAGLKFSSASVAFATFAAVIVHKVPETLALVALLIAGGWSRKSAMFALILFSLMSPLGIMINFSPLVTGGLDGGFSAMMLAASTGTFLYIASSDLLPHLHRKEAHQFLDLGAFILGILLLAIPDFH
jgi:zinc and cadmium transporter